jgi:hypothetical protein
MRIRDQRTQTATWGTTTAPRPVHLALLAFVLAAPLALGPGCTQPHVKGDAARVAGKDPAQLWVEPKDLEARDLFLGPGGQAAVPGLEDQYRVTGYDTTGHSRGYDVEDSRHRKWRIKTSEEAQSEVVVSRVLWAIGYHQPVLHYMKSWRLTGGKPEDEAKPGRFRLESDHKTAGRWGWGKDNPFYGTRPLRALIVANLVLNNWDFGVDQNRIYKMKDGANDHGGPEVRYVVQDVGASLGKSRWPLGSRNNVDDFESQGFVKGVEEDRVVFDYKSRHRLMVKNITTEDVVWTCRLLDRLSDKQWRDAFRAADYSPEVTDRYMRKIRAKVHEGLALRSAERASL